MCKLKVLCFVSRLMLVEILYSETCPNAKPEIVVGYYFKMIRRKLLRAVFGLLLIFAIAVGLTAVNHPIILKWLSGSARLVGRPTNATVYTDGQVNTDIKFFMFTNTGTANPLTTTFCIFLMLITADFKF